MDDLFFNEFDNYFSINKESFNLFVEVIGGN
jgi:hypothetical protein